MACMSVPLPAVVRSRLIEGTTTADSPAWSVRIASQIPGSRCCSRS